MIGRAKALVKQHWPALRLRSILLLTLLFVASLPGFGALFLRVYEDTLVRRTEAEPVARGAALAATAGAVWPGARPRPAGGSYAPETTVIDFRPACPKQRGQTPRCRQDRRGLPMPASCVRLAQRSEPVAPQQRFRLDPQASRYACLGR